MSAPSDGISLSDEAVLSQLGQRLQRDVNCLSDPDRSTRRRALSKLQQVFFRDAKVSCGADETKRRARCFVILVAKFHARCAPYTLQQQQQHRLYSVYHTASGASCREKYNYYYCTYEYHRQVFVGCVSVSYGVAFFGDEKNFFQESPMIGFRDPSNYILLLCDISQSW